MEPSHGNWVWEKMVKIWSWRPLCAPWRNEGVQQISTEPPTTGLLSVFWWISWIFVWANNSFRKKMIFKFYVHSCYSDNILHSNNTQLMSWVSIQMRILYEKVPDNCYKQAHNSPLTQYRETSLNSTHGCTRKRKRGNQSSKQKATFWLLCKLIAGVLPF